MNNSEIRRLRQHNQLIAFSGCKTPRDVVSHMGAMQAQEYAMAKWAVGLRLPGSFESDIEDDLIQGRILRTHILRPTWHFAASKDIRMLIKLTAPHVQRLNAYMYKKTELTADIFKRSCSVIEKALQGGKQLTREELAVKFLDAGIEAKGHRLSYIMMNAELSEIVCSGARKGKKFTYALIDELVSEKCRLNREEALAIFAMRYFASRGPATVRDFAYWSGLPMKDAREGADCLDARYVRDGEYVFLQPPGKLHEAECSFLMPDYDEYAMGYKDRDALLAYPSEAGKASVYSHWMVFRGVIAGTWELEKKKEARVTVKSFFAPDKAGQDEIDIAISRYRRFFNQQFPG